MSTKVSGIYKITNKLNGKVYIGQSKDIMHRFKYYQWSATTNSNYNDTNREIIKDMRLYGLDNFEFEIIASGEEYAESAIDRAMAEQFYINKYKSNNPKYGYNDSVGGE